MLFSIRPLRDEEYEAAAALCGFADPGHGRTADGWRREDQGAYNSVGEVRRWAAVGGAGGIVGYAALWRVRDGKFRFDALVHPDARGRGIGGALFGAVLDAAEEAGAATLQGRAWDDDPGSLAFLRRRGFHEVHRMVELRLDLAAADLSPFAALPERLAAEGFRFRTFEQAQAEDADFWAKLTALQNAAAADWPDPDPGGPFVAMSEEKARGFFAGFRALPGGFFVADEGGRYAGYSGAGLDEHAPAGHAGSGPTAVHPAYRGRGLATALKYLGLAEARRQGYTVAVSQSANPAMVRVNEKLGFRRDRAEVRLVLPVASGSRAEERRAALASA
ncbi:MAG TPA: GNAT family N-acetyltransferase [Longimicrobium sp.]|jgi:GNAT superfamily N-acetyltransferase